MQIAGYLKTSLIEWPGKISSVIFTPGCNFRCPFCHNRDLVNSNIATKQHSYKEEEILADLANRRKWVDAVVVTGGEPTLQKDLSSFLKKVKDNGFLTMLETNGTRPEVIASLFHCSSVDYITMDLKGNFQDYEKFTGTKVDMDKIKESIKLIIESGKEYEFRTTVVPGLHTKENLVQLAKDLKFIVHSSKFIVQPKWFLQQFRPMNTLDRKFMKVEPFSKGQMESFQKSLKTIIVGVFLRGV